MTLNISGVMLRRLAGLRQDVPPPSKKKHRSSLLTTRFDLCEVECWKIKWTLVDDKTERLLIALHATSRGLYAAIYSIISIFGNKREFFQ
jgi:hypothetical protein